MFLPPESLSAVSRAGATGGWCETRRRAAADAERQAHHLSVPREDEDGRVLLCDDIVGPNLALRPSNPSPDDTSPSLIRLSHPRNGDEESCEKLRTCWEIPCARSTRSSEASEDLGIVELHHRRSAVSGILRSGFMGGGMPSATVTRHERGRGGELTYRST